ncbi:MAG: glycosyl hydrolase [Planctomycetota bacterium]
MLWGDAQPARQAKRIADLKERASAGEISHLLAFNEPDQHEQANMQVRRGLELWPDLMEVGVPLVSPGCVHPDGVWMHGFMEEVERQSLRVDAVAVHSYMGPSVSYFMRKMEAVHKAFGRPLWITEFAVGDWNAKTRDENKHSPERIHDFMRELLPELESSPFIHRYAWFCANPISGPLGTSALFDEANQLTPLGELYASHAG